MSPIDILVVDDHRVFAEALQVRLSAEPDLRVVQVVTKARDVAAAVGSTRPAVVIMDVGLDPGDGIELTGTLRARPDPPAVVVLTCHVEAATAAAAVREGASAFVAKDAAIADLLAAVRAAARGQAWLSPDLLAGVLGELRGSGGTSSAAERAVAALSQREREILALMLDGRDRRDIAAALCLSTNTVRTHTQRLLAKLGAHSSVEAVAIARRAGLSPIPGRGALKKGHPGVWRRRGRLPDRPRPGHRPA